MLATLRALLGISRPPEAAELELLERTLAWTVAWLGTMVSTGLVAIGVRGLAAAASSKAFFSLFAGEAQPVAPRRWRVRGAFHLRRASLHAGGRRAGIAGTARHRHQCRRRLRLAHAAAFGRNADPRALRAAEPGLRGERRRVACELGANDRRDRLFALPGGVADRPEVGALLEGMGAPGGEGQARSGGGAQEPTGRCSIAAVARRHFGRPHAHSSRRLRYSTHRCDPELHQSKGDLRLHSGYAQL